MSYSHRIGALPLNRSTIQAEAESLFWRFVHEVGEQHVMNSGIVFEEVYVAVIFPEYKIDVQEGLDLGFAPDGQKILGQYDPIGNRVLIDACIGPCSDDPRRVFTLWHEVGGHGVLQGSWLRNEFERLRRTDPLVTTDLDIAPEAREWLERQANIFAGHAAAPLPLVNAMTHRTFRLTKPLFYFKPGHYWLDIAGRAHRQYVSSFGDLCRAVARAIRHRFGGLSVEALSYQVQQSKLVLDKSRKQVGLFRVAS